MFTNIQIDINQLPKIEDVQLKPINKRYFNILLFNCGFFYLILMAGLMAANYFIEDGNVNFPLKLLIGLILIVLILHIVFLKLAFKNRRYALREKDLIFSKGYITFKTTILPFNRVQHVEISKSFLERKLGLSTLKIYTAGNAGSDLTIRGLSQNEAHSINTYLTTLLNESV